VAFLNHADILGIQTSGSPPGLDVLDDRIIEIESDD
jgi:hypothetical protein